MVINTAAVALRVLTQLRRDPRFVGISLVMPVLIVYMLKLFFEGATSPIVDPNKFVVPVGAFIIHFITYALCAIVLVQERTNETLGRMFINGYRQFEIIGGYLLAYSLLATLQSLIVLVGLRLLFHLGFPIETYAALYLVTWLLSILSITLGMLVSNFARSEGQVFPMIPLVVMMSVFFSGIILPVERLPEIIRWVRFFTPMFYANESIQQLILRGSHFSDGFAGIAGLLIYGTILLSLATTTLREQD